ncbi:hypothetical protein [Streptomyces sp. NBC_00996]|uniref:hypothetical protein n=1 Tax=Streptomyces sp. NBC_00996 TaxID=2903710 RepID=UPI00386A0AD9|nr:hypothetical protein OG390_02205 [Streptomyces sp. NBC_00996]
MPAPGNSGLLAHVGFAAHAPSAPEEELPARAMAHRYTYRGQFVAEPVADAPRRPARAGPHAPSNATSTG